MPEGANPKESGPKEPESIAAHSPARQRVGFGIAMKIAAIFLLSVMDALAKWLAQDLSPLQIVFFRHLFGLLPVLVMIHQAGGLTALRTRRPWEHALRTLLIWFALLAFFTALQSMPLAEAIAIAFAAPLFVTALSMPMLGERVGLRRWAAVIVGFLGVLVIVRPDPGALRVEALLVLASALGYALIVLITRKQGRTETAVATVFYSTVGSALLCTVFLPFVWTTPTAEQWGLLFALGLLGGIGSFFMVMAYRSAPAAVVAPFDYTALIWGAAIGWLVWLELPDAPVWIGAVIVMASGLYIIRRETAAGRKRSAQSAAKGVDSSSG